jgi:hypothetical protein
MEAGYLSVYLWAAAAQQAGQFGTSSIVNSLLDVIIKGPEGYVQIQPNRHAARMVRIAQINGKGKSEVVWQSRAAQPPHPFPSALFIAQAGMIKTKTDKAWNDFANTFIGNESEPQ